MTGGCVAEAGGEETLRWVLERVDGVGCGWAPWGWNSVWDWAP